MVQHRFVLFLVKPRLQRNGLNQYLTTINTQILNEVSIKMYAVANKQYNFINSNYFVNLDRSFAILALLRIKQIYAESYPASSFSIKTTQVYSYFTMLIG